MSFDQTNALKNALVNQIRRLTAKTDQLQKRSKNISTIRLVGFLAGLGIIYLFAQVGIIWLFWVVLIAVVAGFMALISWHRAIDRMISQFSGMATIRKQQLARARLAWEQLDDYDVQGDYSSHPFAHDFDITGSHSLLQLLDTSTYSGSKKYLEAWLLTQHPTIKHTKERQQLLKELRPMAYFRDKLQLRAHLTHQKNSDNQWDMDELLDHLKRTTKKKYTLPLALLGILAVTNITLLILYLTGLINPYVIFTFIAYLLTYNFFKPKVTGLFDEATELNHLLSQLRGILLYLESFPFKKGSKLESFCAIFQGEQKKPSRYLKTIIHISAAASSQGSEIAWLLLNSLVPWDMYFAQKLNRYKLKLAPQLGQWLNRFYRLEALNSLANFGWLHPGYTFALPEAVTKNKAVFAAKKLGHPLIPQNEKVANDVNLQHIGDVHLITGSNMAGKSTFLRTVGINLALCYAGAPVNAHSLKTVPFRLFSSINVTDSLDEGLSHFYAEVKRLRKLLDELNKDDTTPLLFMVDEIYRGTNNRERLAGSEAFLKEVAGKNGVGLISTHDLELAQLEEKITSLSNWHFEETIDDGKMYFEYKLKSGPCSSTNALRIMEMEGLPVS